MYSAAMVRARDTALLERLGFDRGAAETALAAVALEGASSHDSHVESAVRMLCATRTDAPVEWVALGTGDADSKSSPQVEAGLNWPRVIATASPAVVGAAAALRGAEPSTPRLRKTASGGVAGGAGEQSWHLSGSPPLRAEARAPPLPALDARQFRDDELDELIRIEDERRRLLALLAEASPEAIVRALRAQLIQAGEAGARSVECLAPLLPLESYPVLLPGDPRVYPWSANPQKFS